MQGLERGRNQICTHLSQQQKRKKISLLEKERILSRLVPSTDIAALKRADVVIEAVFEDLPLKHKVIQQIEQHVGKVSIFLGKNISVRFFYHFRIFILSSEFELKMTI